MMPDKVLIIDDEDNLRHLLSRIIALEGYEVLQARDCHSALKLIEQQQPNVVLCDVKLPDGNGVDMVISIKQTAPDIEIILLTAYGNIPDGVQAIRNGAFDYITKGDDNSKIIPLIARAVEKNHMQRLQTLSDKPSNSSFDTIIGSSVPMQTAITMARKVAATEASVLLVGETGTGKDVFARAIHAASQRADKHFVAINCAAFSKDLLESELFGHKAGSFTGALKDKKGLLDEANHGTLFLDEIGEMPIELQAKLLRVLENKEFIRIGETKTTQTDIRIIAATNRHMEQAVSNGLFREDLYYRLSVFTIFIPSLAERPEDIPEFVAYYTAFFANRMNKPTPQIAADYMQAMQQHVWRGNVRELRNAVERSLILMDGTTLRAEHLAPDLQLQNNSTTAAPTTLKDVERLHIEKILQHTHGNKSEAARLLNIGTATLYRKIEEYHIQC